MDEYVKERHIAKATIKQKVLTAPPLERTREYRYIEPMPAGHFATNEWDPEKGAKARKRSVEVRQAMARKKSKDSRERNHPRRAWTAEQIAEIKRMRAQGMIWKDIGKIYNVSDSAVRLVYVRATENKGE